MHVLDVGYTASVIVVIGVVVSWTVTSISVTVANSNDEQLRNEY